MTIYTPEMKKNIQDGLKKMNEDIAKAKKQIQERKYRDAARTVADIIDKKHETACSFPGIEPRPGIWLPFSPIFELFEEIDREARRIWPFFTDLDMGKQPADEDIDAYIARLRNLIRELQHNLIDRPRLDKATGARQIRDIIDKLNDMIEQARDARKAGGKKETNDHARKRVKILEQLHQAKHDYLEQFPSPIPLGDAYELLFLIDEALWYCLPYLQDPNRIREGVVERLISQLDDAAHNKHHVEEMVEKSVAKGE